MNYLAPLRLAKVSGQPLVLLKVSITLMKHHESKLGRKELTLPHCNPSLKELKQGRNLKAEADAEAMEKG